MKNKVITLILSILFLLAFGCRPKTNTDVEASDTAVQTMTRIDTTTRSDSVNSENKILPADDKSYQVKVMSADYLADEDWKPIPIGESREDNIQINDTLTLKIYEQSISAGNRGIVYFRIVPGFQEGLHGFDWGYDQTQYIHFARSEGMFWFYHDIYTHTLAKDAVFLVAFRGPQKNYGFQLAFRFTDRWEYYVIL